MTPEIQAFVKSVATRFAKGGVAGAIAAVSALSLVMPSTWHDFGTAVMVLGYSVIAGFISGGLLAVEKAYNWTPVPPTQ